MIPFDGPLASRRACAAAFVAVVASLALLVGVPGARAEAEADDDAATAPGSLGSLAPHLEGTWELARMQLPDGRVLEPPLAEGTIVVDGASFLAASYLRAGPERRVGSLWQGELFVHLDGAEGTWRVTPRTGFQYDSAADPPARPALPPATEGTLRLERDALVFERPNGTVVRWLASQQRRVQHEPDGTVIEHRRTSLVPRIPDDLPGR